MPSGVALIPAEAIDFGVDDPPPLRLRPVLCAEEGRSIYRYGPYAFAEMHIVEIGAPGIFAETFG